MGEGRGDEVAGRTGSDHVEPKEAEERLQAEGEEPISLLTQGGVLGGEGRDAQDGGDAGGVEPAPLVSEAEGTIASSAQAAVKRLRIRVTAMGGSWKSPRGPRQRLGGGSKPVHSGQESQYVEP